MVNMGVVPPLHESQEDESGASLARSARAQGFTIYTHTHWARARRARSRISGKRRSVFREFPFKKHRLRLA